MPDFGIRRGERLRLGVTSSVSNNIDAYASIVYDDGSRDEISVPQLAGGTVRTPQTADSSRRASRDGRVVGCQVTFSAIAKRGQTYGTLNIIDSGLSRVGQGLCSGYLYGLHGLTLGDFEGPLTGKGVIRSIAGTNPGAGVEITEAVPTNARWRPLSVDTINAIGAASVNVSLTITDGTSQKWRSALVVTGTGTELIVWARGVTLNEADLFSTVPLLDGEIEEAFELVTAGISADDDYATPQLLVEEWIHV